MVYEFEPVTRPDPVDLEEDEEEIGSSTAEGASMIRLLFLNVTVASATTDLENADTEIVDKIDPYCEVTAGGITQKTEILQNDLNPVWDSKMHFFVAEYTDKITFQVMNDDKKDDAPLGKTELDLTSLKDMDGTFHGELNLDGASNMKLNVHVECHKLKPVETEKKLERLQIQFAKKCEEQGETVAALDESEGLRKLALEMLSLKEEELGTKAQELSEQQELYQQDVTEKLLKYQDQTQEMESTVQQLEESKLLVSEMEQKKNEVETKLRDAEEEMARSKEALTTKEKEMEDIIQQKMEEAETAHLQVEKRIEELEAIRAELEQDIKTKEQVIHSQGKLLDQNKEEKAELLAAKEQLLAEKTTSQVIVENVVEEEKKEEPPQKGKKQGAKGEVVVVVEKLQGENEDLRSQLEKALAEVENISSTKIRYEQQKQSEVNTLYKKNEELQEELKTAQEELQKSKAYIDRKTQEQACGDANCVVM